MLFDKSMDDIQKEYGDLITSLWDKTNTIIMVDTDTRIGLYPLSDMILSFSPDGSLAIQCERAFKRNYTEKEWAILSLQALSSVHSAETCDGIVTACTHSGHYIDFIKYKKEWLDWADEIVKQHPSRY